jgi:hypothetical protein
MKLPANLGYALARVLCACSDYRPALPNLKQRANRNTWPLMPPRSVRCRGSCVAVGAAA